MIVIGVTHVSLGFKQIQKAKNSQNASKSLDKI